MAKWDYHVAHGEGGVLTGRLAYRAAALAVSALAHVLVYGALSLAPAWPPPPRALLITDLIVTEAPVTPAPRPVTPPRPLVRPKPPTTPVEAAPVQSAAKVEPPVEQNVPEPPIVTPPPRRAAAESTRDAIEAPPAASSSVTMFSDGGAAAVAALPPGRSAAPSGALSRTAIPRGGYQVTPSYPATARRLGIQGTALLRVFVDADGRVGDVVVKQSAGHPDLDRAAADAVRRWRFEPARHGAETVAMWVELPFEFLLR